MLQHDNSVASSMDKSKWREEAIDCRILLFLFDKKVGMAMIIFVLKMWIIWIVSAFASRHLSKCHGRELHHGAQSVPL